ncbi:MAG: MarR family transcriptional regulator [Cytophagia bacterium]|nr:MAG: MarR family transcriptional regulator [Cytophagia bacterium]TAG42505.1 MAG: MarR family transcriptional regulator [Cytophagia bacterium]
MANIEQEIYQKIPFSNEREKLIVNLMFTAHWLETQEREFLKKYSITLPQYNILRILRGQSPNCISVVDIKKRMIDGSPDVSRLVERLRKQDYVSRFESEVDKRLVDVKITEKGLILLQEIQKEREKNQPVFSHIDENELKNMNFYLDKLRTKP